MAKPSNQEGGPESMAAHDQVLEEKLTESKIAELYAEHNLVFEE